MRDQYLLDTNVVSLMLKGRSPHAVEVLARKPRARVGVSVITEMELRFGLEEHPAPGRLKPVVDGFLSAVRVLALPPDISPVYGRLRWALERAGRGIGPLDAIIAAHSIALGAILVTNNTREFGRVGGLRCEDWT